MQAFLSSCARAGIEPVADTHTADAAVIWSVLWHGRMKANRAVYEHYRNQGKPVVCIDVGALHRGRTWKIAVNNITGQGFYGHQQDLDWDRPKMLNVCLQQLSKVKAAILIAAQHPASLQVEAMDQTQWFLHQIKDIRTVSDLPIVLRPHPRGPINWQALTQWATIQSVRPVQGTYDSFDIDYGYRAVVNVNSGVGIQAAIAGAQVIVDTTSLAYPISIPANAVHSPTVQDRQQWLIEICHTEYTLDEIQQGLWLKRIYYKLNAQ